MRSRGGWRNESCPPDVASLMPTILSKMRSTLPRWCIAAVLAAIAPTTLNAQTCLGLPTSYTAIAMSGAVAAGRPVADLTVAHRRNALTASAGAGVLFARPDPVVSVGATASLDMARLRDGATGGTGPRACATAGVSTSSTNDFGSVSIPAGVGLAYAVETSRDTRLVPFFIPRALFIIDPDQDGEALLYLRAGTTLQRKRWLLGISWDHVFSDGSPNTFGMMIGRQL